RLNATLVALLTCSLALPTFAEPRPPDPVRAQKAAPARATVDPAPGLASMVVEQLRTRANSLRRQGDYQAALDAYRSEMTITGETADCWKHIGWTQKALRRFADAEASLRRATELDPTDREAQEDLENLRISRGLRLNARMGGNEPGTSKQAYEG